MAVGRGITRFANCDACVQRARCAGALGGDLAVSGCTALFLLNEAAECVGCGVRAGSLWAWVRREAAGNSGAWAAEGAAQVGLCGPGSTDQLSRAYWA